MDKQTPESIMTQQAIELRDACWSYMKEPENGGLPFEVDVSKRNSGAVQACMRILYGLGYSVRFIERKSVCNLLCAKRYRTASIRVDGAWNSDGAEEIAYLHAQQCERLLARCLDTLKDQGHPVNGGFPLCLYVTNCDHAVVSFCVRELGKAGFVAEYSERKGMCRLLFGDCKKIRVS